MSKFYDDGVTIVALCTLCIGALGMVAKLCFKSKCSNINICVSKRSATTYLLKLLVLC